MSGTSPLVFQGQTHTSEETLLNITFTTESTPKLRFSWKILQKQLIVDRKLTKVLMKCRQNLCPQILLYCRLVRDEQGPEMAQTHTAHLPEDCPCGVS